MSDRQTFSDKFRAKEKEITGTNNPNIIIASGAFTENNGTDSDLKLSAPGDRIVNSADILKRSNDLDISQMVLTQKATTQTEALKNLERLAGRDIKNRETGIDAQINSTQRNKLVSKVALSKSKDNGFSFEDHFTAVANIDQLFENGSMVDDRPDKDGDPNVLSVKRFSAPLLLGDEFAEAYITVKETVGNKIYSIELDEIKKPSDITGGTLKERYHIPEGYNNLLQKIEKARELLKKSENSELKLSAPGDRGDTSLDPVEYRRSIDPMFDFFMEYSDNGILNPGSAHIGEDFSGAFISPEFVAYSVKRKQGKNESDATYRKYLERRQSALENASGASLDTMAKDYVEKFGGDEAEVAEKFLDMLRHLSKKDLISERAEAKREAKEAADKQRKEDEAEWQKQKAETLRKKVDELFKAAKPVVDKRWIQINRQIYTALFKTVFPDAEIIPDIPSDREMRILNMVLENGNMSEAALIAEPYYTDKDKVLKDKLDKAQAETLTEFILRSRGGKGFMGLFHDINGKPDIKLLEYALMTFCHKPSKRLFLIN